MKWAGMLVGIAGLRQETLSDAKIQLRRSSRAAGEQCLEIGTRALGLEARSLGGFTHAEIAVDQAGALMMPDGNAGSFQRPRVGSALVAQRIKPGRRDHGRRNAGERFGPQRRDAPVL